MLVAAVALGSNEEGTRLNCLAIIISPPVVEDEFVALTTAYIVSVPLLVEGAFQLKLHAADPEPDVPALVCHM